MSRAAKNHTVASFDSFLHHLRIESFALALLMVVLTYKSSYPLWVLGASFLLFDLSMVGYLRSPRTGAKVYNFFHNSTLPTLFIVTGLLLNTELISVIGFTWTFHIAVDRTLGYGLKHTHSFHATHLGVIGKK